MPTQDFFGYRIYAGSSENLLNEARLRALSGRRLVIFAMNPRKYVSAFEDSQVRSALGFADILIADGVGITAVSRIANGRALERIPGIDLMDRLLGVFSSISSPVFFYGARPSILDRAMADIRKRHPSLIIAGSLDGYACSEADAVRTIGESGAKCLFVALGSPKQEMFIAEALPSLAGVTFAMGIGGSLDVVSGEVARAPALMRRLGLEWMHRLLMQPSRARQNHMGKYLFLIAKERFFRK
ncbi:MAG: WecB/TagA/CpsF family glycosyltransferase [Eubacteriaceae bacterium]|nr:WecB/TagA/CpsF family glycosyltransferase [Eubacteriaceae bacterium]